MCGLFFFFFNDTATTEIYTLSLHDALPIFIRFAPGNASREESFGAVRLHHSDSTPIYKMLRSEEHTSELQSRLHLVCRLLLEKKKLISLDQRLPPDNVLKQRLSPPSRCNSP